MRSLIFIVALFFYTFSGNAQATIEVEKEASTEIVLVGDTDYIEWKSLVYDFGAIEQDKVAEGTFEFKNTGSTPFLLTKVNGSCGCTATEYTKMPILPQTTEIIKASYDAKEVGKFVKSITVFTSEESRPYILMLRGEVIEKTQD